MNRVRAGVWYVSLALSICFAFVLLNVGAYVVLKHMLELDIFDEKSYSDYKGKFLKPIVKASIPHPFIGKIEFSGEMLKSDLSSEPLFNRIYKSDSGRDIKILILGGSVARHMARADDIGVYDLFARKVNERFQTNRFSVFSAALGGGKQPQQYFKLIYLDLLGFRPDIVINYDGFNEIALPLGENRSVLIPPIFPRLYSGHLESSVARSCARVNNHLLSMETKVPFIAFVVDWFVKYCDDQINSGQGIPWWADQFPAGGEDEYAKQSRLIWLESSNHIYAFTKSRGIEYIHVIQPNQYYPNSKVLSPEEKAKVLSYPKYGDPIAKYYNLLSREGLEVKNFRDQRGLFGGVTETVYVDRCCHLNSRGMEYIVDDILIAFSDVFKNQLRK